MLQVSSGGVGLYNERLIVALGFATLASALATFSSCRSCLSFLSHFGLKSLLQTKWYGAFYRYHGYYWWIFVFGLVLHTLTAAMHTAIPIAGDPDATIHWIILSFALSSLVLVGVVLSSCRSFVGLLNLFMEKTLLSNRLYEPLYRYHSHYWTILALLLGGHLIGAYTHVGIWPG